MKKLLFVLVCICCLYLGCKTDFDINAEYKETTVVYGLLDRNEKAQMIKINKTFLTNGDASQFAMEPDAINYDPADLKVTMDEVQGTSIIRTLTLHDSIIPHKQAGDFSTAKNIVYVTYAKLDSSKSYNLKVENLKTGNIVTASTPLIDYIDLIIKPGYMNFVTQVSMPTTPGKYSSPNVSWYTKKYAKTYQVNVRFYYREKNVVVTPNVTQNKFLDWPQAILESTTIGSKLTQPINGLAFYQYLQSSIAEDDNVVRYADSLVVTLSVGTEELDNYIKINKPGSDFNQDKPTYTNIVNGLGIFSTRFKIAQTKYFCSTFPVAGAVTTPCTQAVPSYVEFIQGRYTSRLGFQYP